MTTISKPRVDQVGWLYRAVIALAVLAVAERDVQAGFTLDVRDSAGNPVSGFRWLVEEDNTNQPIPGEAVWDMLAVDIHHSHAPVVAKGHTDGSAAFIDVPSDGPYVVSVLPDSGHTIGGGNVAIGQGQITVIVNAYPVPTAQISILAFHDNWPINNAPEVPIEAGLQGFTIMISDAAGQISQDAFGNPLGTTYEYDINGNPVFDEDGNPVVVVMGSGVIATDELGEALVKYLAPGKYGIQIIPPADENWIQTTTIEGTPTIDAWVKAGEPPVFVEFGPAAYHVFIGFVQAFDEITDEGGENTATITGHVVYNHFSRPPTLQGFFPGPPVQDAWVGLNEVFSRKGVYAQPCNEADGSFTITGVPDGVYQLVTWDKHLDSIFAFNVVTVPDPVQGYAIDLGDVLAFAWFGTLQGSIFFDADEDGFRDTEEIGMPGMEVLLRFRDGTIYQLAPTDFFGDYAFTEVFPFFKWLVAEVDFLRHKATGITTAVDYGGEIPPHNGWITPSFGKLNPQPQADINPNTGNNLSRTEIGEVLTQAMHLFLSQANVIDWGKGNYAPGESGGISGIVFYAVTRAEDDPRYAAGEEWEPGVPRVQVNLYEDMDEDGVIDELDGDGLPTLADQDNYPLGWFDDPGLMGDEDVDWNENGVFDPGDAIQVTWTDSWDDDTPTGCIQDLPVIHGHEVAECFDNFGTWNQARPGVFDGGFAFASYFPGGMANNDVEEEGLPGGIYIVEGVPPASYETIKEEDKNVDYGDEYIPGDPLAAIPAACVGDLHTVPDYLTLFGDIEAPFAGAERPLCDRKQVAHSCGQNTGVEFFLFTEVPKAARAVGFINNDLAPEFDESSPIFGEKQAPSWLPISFQDYVGNEITRVYCDEFGAYNALLPSSFTVNLPSPTGVSPHMISFVVNHPGPISDPEDPGQLIMDPWFDAGYSQTPYTFNFESGRTTYLDTPVIPVAAFVGYPTYGVDIDPPDETPMIHSVKGPRSAKGPYVCADGEIITIRSLGLTRQGNPGDPGGGTVQRDYGFGRTRGEVTVGGVSLRIRGWNNRQIRAEVDTDLVSTGQLLVTRGDNGRTTPLGVTLHVLDDCSSVVEVTHGGAWPSTPIQDAIDAAAPGTLIIVGPGVYKENPIIYKRVKLQGAGAGGTFINGNPVPFERVTAWHNKINALIASGDLVPVDPGMFEPIEAPCVFVHGKPETFDEDSPGLIDGFTIMGGVSGGGIYAAGYADYLEISNNKLMNNQGTFGGGVTVGLSDQSGFNDHVNIHHNLIGKNGGINGAGGVTIFRGSDNYSLADNLIIGNFTRFSGGGVCHHGLSDGGTIARNQIVFNEVFYGGELGGEGGGIYVGGGVPDPEDPPGEWGPGAGSVIIDSNLIQGNLAGSDSGGGLRAFHINGSESAELDPDDWYTLRVFNNMIVNNVAAYQGGGIALTDVAKSHIINNTVANNDCTATSALAFPPGNLLHSNPQGAGIVSTQHSPHLAGVTGPLGLPSFSDPQLEDNVVWHNRSFYWDGTLNDFKGGLVANDPPHWDLQVVGAGSLNPQYCVLTDTSGYDASNISDDPTFVTEYNNTLLTASVLDEGGNFITVRYTELMISDGDYHLQPASPAIDAGTDLSGTFPELATDFDGKARPNPDTGLVDIGADEVYTPGSGASGPGSGGNTPKQQPSRATKGVEL